MNKGIHIFCTAALLFLLSSCLSTAEYQAHVYQDAQTNYQKKNYEIALTELLPLAESGHADAQYTVGYMIYYGLGTEKNRINGKAMTTQAAEQGQTDAIQALKELKV